MFGVASNFRKTHGEAAFSALALTAFTEADTDGSGCIDMSELKTTLGKVGMKLTDAQTAAIVDSYDADGNHELDSDEVRRRSLTSGGTRTLGRSLSEGAGFASRRWAVYEARIGAD